MNKLQFNYLYRDSGNYKQYGYVVFANPENLHPEEATAMIREKLISEEFFVAEEWDVPSLRKDPYDPEIDHGWHEFEEFKWTKEEVTDNRLISDFLNGIKKGAGYKKV
ncbi:hypothetical protein IFO69_10595 [Echinicola sp. CAU 1574]|uniref:Uncharacterized protein n=1 Tax=Echinicola arenosa TaxID=2774144 RepID=A0ABR9AK55_9BACT|nr:hypothetical protein [Echinicola arenosa]MBD8489194.1 hypothetical protein [Echinicola arenosa]